MIFAIKKIKSNYTWYLAKYPKNTHGDDNLS